MADPLLAMVGAFTLGIGAIIAVVALVALGVQCGLALAHSVERMFTAHREQ